MKTTTSFAGFLSGYPVVREQDEWEHSGIVHKDDTLTVYGHDYSFSFRSIKKAEDMIAMLQNYISTFNGGDGEDD